MSPLLRVRLCTLHRQTAREIRFEWKLSGPLIRLRGKFRRQSLGAHKPGEQVLGREHVA